MPKIEMNEGLITVIDLINAKGNGSVLDVASGRVTTIFDAQNEDWIISPALLADGVTMTHATQAFITSFAFQLQAGRSPEEFDGYALAGRYVREALGLESGSECDCDGFAPQEAQPREVLMDPAVIAEALSDLDSWERLAAEELDLGLDDYDGGQFVGVADGDGAWTF